MKKSARCGVAVMAIMFLLSACGPTVSKEEPGPRFEEKGWTVQESDWLIDSRFTFRSYMKENENGVVDGRITISWKKTGEVVLKGWGVKWYKTPQSFNTADRQMALHLENGMWAVGKVGYGYDLTYFPDWKIETISLTTENGRKGKRDFDKREVEKDNNKKQEV